MVGIAIRCKKQKLTTPNPVLHYSVCLGDLFFYTIKVYIKYICNKVHHINLLKFFDLEIAVCFFGWF